MNFPKRIFALILFSFFILNVKANTAIGDNYAEISATLVLEGEVHSYSFNISENESIHIKVAAIDGGLSPKIILRNSFDEVVASSSDHKVANIRGFSATQGGSYSLEVSSLNDTGETGQYILYYAKAPGANEHGLLGDLTESEGVIDLGDIDTYSFNASTGDKVQIRVADLDNSTFFPSVFIYGPDGTQVAQADGYDVAAVRQYSVAQSGNYTVVVTAGNANGLSDTEGNYALYFVKAPGANELGMTWSTKFTQPS